MDAWAQAGSKFTLLCLFLSFRPSVDWVMPTALVRVILFTLSANSNANLSGNALGDIPRNNVHQLSRHPQPSQVDT